MQGRAASLDRADARGGPGGRCGGAAAVRAGADRGVKLKGQSPAGRALARPGNSARAAAGACARGTLCARGGQIGAEARCSGDACCQPAASAAAVAAPSREVRLIDGRTAGGGRGPGAGAPGRLPRCGDGAAACSGACEGERGEQRAT